MSAGKRDHTGTLTLAGGVLRNRSTWFGDWELPISRIRLIGEATDENGPFADDWYFVFAADSTCWHEASCYAPGARELVADLGRILGEEVGMLGLQGSTAFDSRVLWPRHMEGHSVFRYDPDSPGNLLERLVYPLIKPGRNVQQFTAEIASFLSTSR